MARQNRTRVDLAAALGVSYTAATRRFDGTIPLDVSELDLLAAWLDVPVTRLLGHETPLPAPRAAS